MPLSPELISLLIQIPLVGAFIAFAIILFDRFQKAAGERDSLWQNFLQRAEDNTQNFMAKQDQSTKQFMEQQHGRTLDAMDTLADRFEKNSGLLAHAVEKLGNEIQIDIKDLRTETLQIARCLEKHDSELGKIASVLKK